jgi:hypothetical protein
MDRWFANFSLSSGSLFRPCREGSLVNVSADRPNAALAASPPVGPERSSVPTPGFGSFVSVGKGLRNSLPKALPKRPNEVSEPMKILSNLPIKLGMGDT